MDNTGGSVSFTNGYVCPNCGSWINNGEMHSCYNLPHSTSPNIPVYYTQPDARIGQILDELKEIKKTLQLLKDRSHYES